MIESIFLDQSLRTVHNRYSIQLSNIMKKILLLFFALLITACSNKGGDEFVGQWLDTGRGTSKIYIEKSGDSYTVRDSNPKNSRKSAPGLPMRASIQDGKLVLVDVGGQPSLTYDKNTDMLTFTSGVGMAQYRRVKD